MGCTSSAPNMADTHTNTAETADKNEMPVEENENKSKGDDEVINSDNTASNEINELPTCDNLVENLQLARNNNSISNEISKMDDKEDLLVETNNENVTNKPNNYSLLETLQIQDKLSSLKEVVEHAVLDENILVTSISESHDETQNENGNHEESKETKDIIKIEQAQEEESEESTVEIPQEAASPSQSESSRATRWEALADIAAELPPSLAVDPLTGQIYAHSK